VSTTFSNQPRIIPTVFATDRDEFTERLTRLLPVSSILHLDIMDGTFVGAKSMPIEEIPLLDQEGHTYEAHLMVQNPDEYLSQLKQKGISMIIFHYESNDDRSSVLHTIDQIKKEGMTPCLAFNPDTPVETSYFFAEHLEHMLFMGIYPGKEHQQFIPEVYAKIKLMRRHDPKIIIHLDGGVNNENLGRLVKAGVTQINSGSYISGAEDPKKAYKELSRIVLENTPP